MSFRQFRLFAGASTATSAISMPPVRLAHRPIPRPQDKPAAFTVDEAFDKAGVNDPAELAQARKDLSAYQIAAGVKAGLQQLRLAAGLSQTELAKRIGSTQSYVSRLENRSITNPSSKRLKQLASVFGVTLETIGEAISG